MPFTFEAIQSLTSQVLGSVAQLAAGVPFRSVMLWVRIPSEPLWILTPLAIFTWYNRSMNTNKIKFVKIQDEWFVSTDGIRNIVECLQENDPEFDAALVMNMLNFSLELSKQSPKHEVEIKTEVVPTSKKWWQFWIT